MMMKKSKYEKERRTTASCHSHQKISEAKRLLDAIDVVTSPIFQRCVFLTLRNTRLRNFNFGVIALKSKMGFFVGLENV